MRGGAALHHRADRPPAAPAPLRHDQTPDPPCTGVPGEAGPGPPPTATPVTATLRLPPGPAQQRHTRPRPVLVVLLVVLLALSGLGHHPDLGPRGCGAVAQQQLRGFAATLVPPQRGGAAGVQLRYDGRGGVGPGGEGGGVHEVRGR